MTSFPARLRPVQAATYLGVAVATLAKWRVQGSGPEFVKLGKRVVLYPVSALDAYLAENTKQSTSEY